MESQQSKPYILLFFKRVRDLLISPNQVWEEIRAEQSGLLRLYLLYGLPLLILPQICEVAGEFLSGSPRSMGTNLIIASITVLTKFITLYVGGLAIFVSTKMYGGKILTANAHRALLYSFTPFFLSGLLLLNHELKIWRLPFVLWSIALLWFGIKALVEKEPTRKVEFIAFTLATVVVVAAITGSVTSLVSAVLTISAVKGAAF